MRWVHRLKEQVHPSTRTKGNTCFKQNRVTIETGDKTAVAGQVIGSMRHAVEVRLIGEEAHAFCDCEVFIDEDICQHVWAILLEAEKQGFLSRLASAWDPQLVNGMFAVDDVDLDEEDDDDDGHFHQPSSAPPSRNAKKVAPPAPPVWKQHLTALQSAAAARIIVTNESPRRILYIVDIQECLSAGTLVLQAVVSRLKKNGEWGRPNFQESVIYNISQLDSADRRILALLAGTTYSYGYSSANRTVSTRQRLDIDSVGLIMPLITATGRFFLRPTSSPPPSPPADLAPLSWDDGPPWVHRLTVQYDEGRGNYIIRGSLMRPDEETSLATPLLLIPGFVFFSDRVCLLDDRGAFEWIRCLRKEKELTIPVNCRGEFIAQIARFTSLPPLEFPDELRIESAALAGPHRLAIRPITDQWQSQSKLRCEITFDYGTAKVAEGEATECFHDPASDRYFKRDKQAESAAILRLQQLGIHRNSSWNQMNSCWELPASRLTAVVSALVAEGWRVEAEGKLYRRSGRLSISVSSGIDWLELQGNAEFEGQAVKLPELLKAVARGEKMVRLDDGTFGLLPDEWLERYRFVAGLGKAADGNVRFTRGQAGLLDALLASQPEVTFDDGFLRLRRELETFAGVEPLNPSSSFNGTLREYQREGLGWLRFVRRFGFGACLADDMGLGKTVQVLALLESDERRGPALVVVPRSLVFNWKHEAARFAPALRVLDFTGPGRKDRWSHLQEHDLILTTYGTLRRDAPMLKDIRFDTVILDEAQAIKNASTESAKAARLLSAEHRLALTGTPIENHLSDLWSLFEFLNPGLLGSASVFKTQTNGDNAGGSAGILSRALRPFILRRTKEQVARELPPKSEQTIFCELDTTQRKLYDELRQHYRASLLGQVEQIGIEKSRMQILEALLRLRQAACHPGLIDKSRTSEPSAKLEALVPQLQEVAEGGHKALVFSQFTSLLAIVQSRLKSQNIPYEYLDGRTRDRESRVHRFQNDANCRVFLVSLKAAGVGLNLTAAEYVFLLDPWWNPATEAQAIDRSHRIGQSRHVFAYRLIARDTIEEKVMELQKSKRQLAESIITTDNSVLAGLDRETLEVLFS